MAKMHSILQSHGFSTDSVDRAIQRLVNIDRPRFQRFWAYYRNPTRAASAVEASQRPYRLAQEWGLPTRLAGDRSEPAGREVVIENDVAWRIDAMVDFLFGKPPAITSTVEDQPRRNCITQLLRFILDANGGTTFLQHLALIGAVHGYVDVIVKFLPDASAAADTRNTTRSASAIPQGPVAEQAISMNEPGASHDHSPEALVRLARRIRLEIVEPARALPVVSDHDWQTVEAHGQVYNVRPSPPASGQPEGSWLRRLFSARGFAASTDRDVTAIDLVTPDRWYRFHDDELIASGRNALAEIPLVHIQNVAVPFAYAGGSDVEPLLPLQDELNTRLSDRAHRITMQSFRMYLGKGIDNFVQQQVSPGRMWMSENPDAQVIEFGGDAACPSEDAHIREIREALDKTSGVSPIAAGAIKGRIGRLTSAAALRVTMLSLLARTERKRATYGAGLARMCELALAWLDRAGLFHTATSERRIDIAWPNPIPLNEIERLEEARAKLAIGVPREQVLRELGYTDAPHEAHQTPQNA